MPACEVRKGREGPCVPCLPVGWGRAEKGWCLIGTVAHTHLFLTSIF